MDHSKVRLTMRTLHGKICDVFLGEMHLFTASRLVAEPFCACWNEYDTLKDKIANLELDLKFARGTSQTRMDVAQELITKNQTLKAKAELFDEAIEWTDLALTLLTHLGNSKLPSTKESLKRLNTLLSKAKELK